MTVSDIRIEIIDHEEDIFQAYRVVASAFGRQSRDIFWFAFNPGWETPEGEAAGTKRFASRWRKITKDRNGEPNTIFLKATTTDPADHTKRIIVGFAIWVQLSYVEGHGDRPDDGLSKDFIETLHPGNEAEQRSLV